MRTNIEIDDKLMAKAMKASRLEAKTKRAVVEEALQMLVKSRAREKLRDLFGKVEFWDDYDYKSMRGDTPNPLPAAKTKSKSGRPAAQRTHKRRAA